MTYLALVFLSEATNARLELENINNTFLCNTSLIISRRLVRAYIKYGARFPSLFGLHVHSCTYWLRPATPSLPSPAFGLISEGAIGQPSRRHF